MIYKATKSLTEKVEEYAKLKKRIDQMSAQADVLADLLKKTMTDKGIEEMIAGDHLVTYKGVTCSRLDVNALKQMLHEDFLRPYMKETTTHRLIVK